MTKYSVPAIEDYDCLIPIIRELYEHTNKLSWQMLLPMFLVSVVIGYSGDLGMTGSILVRLKRLFIVALLLIAFPTIAEFAQTFGVEIARSIDNLEGIDNVLAAASARAESSSAVGVIVDALSDFLVSALFMISFLILIFARLFLLAFQHFYWFLLISLGPFLILGSLFEASTAVTKGLFKSIIQISCWPIIWALLSAFLKAMSFASSYGPDANLITIVTLNLIVAVALLFSPFLVSQIVEGVNLSIGNQLRVGALKAVSMSNPALMIASQYKSLTKALSPAGKIGPKGGLKK